MLEIRFAGFGGQGIILMGIAVARAAAIYDLKPQGLSDRNKFAIQTQSYGPAARGGHSRSDVKISDEEIYYPFVDEPNVLVLLSDQAYKKYIGEIASDCTIILDEDLVRERPDGEHYLIPATREAEALGTRIVSNMTMLGAFQEITKAVSFEALKQSVFEMVPPMTHELNEKALERGRELGKIAVEQKEGG